MLSCHLISGFGQSATGDGCGMRRLAEELRSMPNVCEVVRWTYRDAERILDACAPMLCDIAFVGHSFGGDAAVECARRINGECLVVAVDPVPRSMLARWTWPRIPVPANARRSLCIMRQYGIYPLAKKLTGPGVEIHTISGTRHDSVMQSIRTHSLIRQFLTEDD